MRRLSPIFPVGPFLRPGSGLGAEEGRAVDQYLGTVRENGPEVGAWRAGGEGIPPRPAERAPAFPEQHGKGWLSRTEAPTHTWRFGLAPKTPFATRGVGCFLLVAGMIALLSAEPLLGSPPNVVMIMADDLGYRDLGCYGHPSIRTPVLDDLAARGVRLTDYHSGATVCTPSRMALLTGAYPTRLGWSRGVIGHMMGVNDGMSPEALTIAEIFQSAGYATAISGKWHLGNQPDTRPHRQGFDSAYYVALSNNQTEQLWRADEVVEEPFENRELTRQFTEEGIRFIRAQARRPFFLYLAYTAPHFPVQPHAEWKGRSQFGDYGDVVEELDARIGELMATLRELDLERQTIVVFCSDNGPNPEEQADAVPFRGEKWSALEGGTRVPCLMAWPGVLPEGREYDGLFSAMDMLPSLCRACGIDWQQKSEGKPRIDGLDLWDALLGRPDAPLRQELLYWHGMDPEPQAIRVGEWKLFFDRRNALDGLGTARATAEQAATIAPYRASLTGEGPHPPILFHLEEDPGETVDRSGGVPAKVVELQRRATVLVRDLREGGTLPIATPPPPP